jgi:2-keto-3-deoxy-L-rhamnonate aldolase RhmA
MPKPMKNPLIAKIQNGERIYGTLVTSPSSHVVPILANAGLDFVFLDTEHVPLDREKLAWMCRCYAAAGLPPVVRIPSPDPYLASAVLDGGAVGILAPYIETVDEVKALVGAVKFKPLKGRRLKRLLEGESSPEGTADYLQRYRKDRLVFINIESTPAIENLDQLLKVPGLDGIIVGPHDLSVSLDLPEQYEHPDYLAALRHIAEKARGTVAITGIHFMDSGKADMAAMWTAFGYNMLILRADLVYLKRGLAAELTEIRDRLGGRASGIGADEIHV